MNPKFTGVGDDDDVKKKLHFSAINSFFQSFEHRVFQTGMFYIFGAGQPCKWVTLVRIGM